MKAVGIKVLKNQLSRYLELVKQGETILILDRDQPIAEIRKPGLLSVGRLSPLEAFMNEMTRNGFAEPARKTKSEIASLLQGRSTEKRISDVDLQDLLDSIRADRY